MAKAKAIYKKHVTEAGKDRVSSLVRYMLVHEAEHNYCSKCSKLKPLDQFSKTKTNEVGYLPYCKEHTAYVSQSVPVEDYQPEKKLKPADLVVWFNDQIDEALKEGKRVPKNLKLAIETHNSNGVFYCPQCRWVHMKR